jgi:hypothetical protein
MAQPRSRPFRDAPVSLGRGSKKRVRRLRARDHTGAGLAVFMLGLFIAAIGLALATGHCQLAHSHREHRSGGARPFLVLAVLAGAD